MRVTNRNGFRPAKALNRLHRLVIQIRDAIPQDISLWCPHEVCRLPYRDLWFGVDGNEVCCRRVIRIHRVKYILVLF